MEYHDPHALEPLESGGFVSYYTPQHLRTGVGMQHGLKSGDQAAFTEFSRRVQQVVLKGPMPAGLTLLLVRHVLSPCSGWKHSPQQPQAQGEQPPGQHDPPDVVANSTLEAQAGSSSSSSRRSREWWCAAVGALASIWPVSCHLLEPATVVDVLQRVVQGVVQYHPQEQQHLQQLFQKPQVAEIDCLRQSRVDDVRRERQLRADVEVLFQGLLPHSTLLEAVLQASSLMNLLAAAAAAHGDIHLSKAMGAMVVQAGVWLQELPAAHSAVCDLLASGGQAGPYLLSVMSALSAQERLGLWQDQLLQAACLEGARKAAAAVAAVVANPGEEGSGGSGGSSLNEQQQQEEEAMQASQAGPGSAAAGTAPAAATPDAAAPGGPQGVCTAADGRVDGSSAAAVAAAAPVPPPPAAAVAAAAAALTSTEPACSPAGQPAPLDASEVLETCSGYAQQLVLLVEVGMSMHPRSSAEICRGMVTAVWQCLLQLVAASTPEKGCSEAAAAACHLLCISAARRVLLWQPGAVCSVEEVCGVLLQMLAMDWGNETVGAVVELLEQSGFGEAALAVPGFAAAVILRGLGPHASDTYADFYEPIEVQQFQTPLLEALVSLVSGRAALLAAPDVLGQLAWVAATSAEPHPWSPHLAQLWDAVFEDGCVEALVAGVEAADENWVRFFGWVVQQQPCEEWSEVPGLLDALITAFDVHMPHGDTTPLEQVLVWLLEGEERDNLFWTNHVVDPRQTVSEWLLRTASPQRPSPLAGLLRRNTAAATAAMSLLAESSLLFEGALVSLVVGRSDLSHYDRLVAAWVRAERAECQVLCERQLLRAVLRAAAAASSTAAVVQDHVGRNTSALNVLALLSDEDLLPVVLELLAGVEQGSSSSATAAGCESAAGLQQLTSVLQKQNAREPEAAPAAAGAPAAVAPPPPPSQSPAAAASTPDVQLVAGAYLALDQIRRRSAEGEQMVLEAMQQLACGAGQVRALQQLEAAGHAALVAAAQARQQLAAEQQQLQLEKQVRQAEQQQLELQRAALAAEQQQLQQEREALRAERQQLELLQAGVGGAGQRKRRHL